MTLSLTNDIVEKRITTQTEEICVWLDDSGIIDNVHESKGERVIRPFGEYFDVFFGTKSDKLTIIQSTYALSQ